MRRVEMQSPASPGTVMVPEGQVADFKARGWRLIEASKPKPKPEKQSPKRRAASSDDSEQ